MNLKRLAEIERAMFARVEESHSKPPRDESFYDGIEAEIVQIEREALGNMTPEQRQARRESLEIRQPAIDRYAVITNELNTILLQAHTQETSL